MLTIHEIIEKYYGDAMDACIRIAGGLKAVNCNVQKHAYACDLYHYIKFGGKKPKISKAKEPVLKRAQMCMNNAQKLEASIIAP